MLIPAQTQTLETGKGAMNRRKNAHHVPKALAAIMLSLLLAACAVKAPAPDERQAPAAPSAEEQAVIQINYNGHNDARGNPVLSEGRGVLKIRYLLDGELLGEHSVGATVRLMARVAAGPHRLTIEGAEGDSKAPLFVSAYEVVLMGGAEASLVGASRDYFTGKTRKNLMMMRWDKEMTMVYGLSDSGGFESFRQVGGEEGEAVLKTLWVQE